MSVYRMLPGFLAIFFSGFPAAAGEFVLAAQTEATFASPHDLALSVDGSRLFVADNGNDVVKVLDAKTLETIGVIGKGELSAPHDVAFDGQGRLLVADTGNDRTAVYAQTGGRWQLTASWEKEHDGPEGVSATPPKDQEGRVYVANAGGDTALALEGGRVIVRVGSAAGAAFSRPHDIEADASGRVILTDPGNQRVLILDKNLKLVRELKGPAYGFNEPKYVAVDGKGWIYLADEYNNRVVVLDRDYVVRGQIGPDLGSAAGGAAGRLNQPEGVVVRGGDIWVADTYNDRILRFRR